MVTLRYKVTKAYLNKAIDKFTLDDIAAARKLFDSASSSRIKRKIASVKNVSLRDGPGVKLRIYRNDLSSKKLPTVVYFHGGGFALGSINSHDSICRSICKYSNCIVVSVEYSLAPEAPYPAPVNEGLAVLEWLSKSGLEYGVNTDEIYLAGDSAGGNIVVKVATSPKLRTVLKGLILIYPTLDPTLSTESMRQYATGYFLTKAILSELWDLYQNGGHTYQPPTKAEMQLLPPVLVIAAEKDILKSEGRNFAEELRALGKEASYECYTDMLHGFVQFPRFVSKKVEVFKRVAEFITGHSR